MKKKIIAILCVAVMTFGLTGCGNKKVFDKEVFDLQDSFNYAIIQLPNDEIVEGKVQSWNDYEGEQLQVKIDGIVYLTSSYNCTLMNK